MVVQTHRSDVVVQTLRDGGATDLRDDGSGYRPVG